MTAKPNRCTYAQEKHTILDLQPLSSSPTTTHNHEGCLASFIRIRSAIGIVIDIQRVRVIQIITQLHDLRSIRVFKLPLLVLLVFPSPLLPIIRRRRKQKLIIIGKQAILELNPARKGRARRFPSHATQDLIVDPTEGVDVFRRAKEDTGRIGVTARVVIVGHGQEAVGPTLVGLIGAGGVARRAHQRGIVGAPADVAVALKVESRHVGVLRAAEVELVAGTEAAADPAFVVGTVNLDAVVAGKRVGYFGHSWFLCGAGL